MSKVSFLGAGSWGTALAIMLANNGHDVTLWSAVESEVEMLQTHREHKDRLPGVKLPESVVVTSDLESACKGFDLIVFSVASPYVRVTAKNASKFIPKGQKIVNVAKGIENDTLMTLRDIICQEMPERDVCVLSGPSHAEEVSIGMPTTVVVGSTTKETAKYVQKIFMNDRFRVYTSPDIIGIELGGSIKNVIALIVTCTSTHSRNHNAGVLIGKGMSMDEAMKEVNQVVEGVYSAKAAYSLAKKYKVSMPIVEQINEVLFDGVSATDAIQALLTREECHEYQGLVWEDDK